MSHKSWVTVLQLQTMFPPPVVLQSVVDSESRFIFIDIGAYGKQSVGGTFPASTLQHFLEEYESTLPKARGELSYLAPLGIENISAPYFKQCFFRGGGVLPLQTVKHHASQSQDRNNKYFILYTEVCINNKI